MQERPPENKNNIDPQQNTGFPKPARPGPVYFEQTPAKRPVRKLTPEYARGEGDSGQTNPSDTEQDYLKEKPLGFYGDTGRQSPFLSRQQEDYKEQLEYFPHPQRKGGKFFLKAFILLLLCIIVSGLVSFFVVQHVLENLEEEVLALLDQHLPQEEMLHETPTTEALTATELYRMVSGQVVTVMAETNNTNVFGQLSVNRTVGTGFIVGENGFILSNYHVIAGASRIVVSLENGDSFEAQVIGSQGVSSDVAMLQIPLTGLTPVTFGDFNTMEVGNPVYVIGNPLGELSHSITGGLISSLRRTVSLGQNNNISMFQVDARVNVGNSGGPVFNDQGEVIGIITARSELGRGEGIGFAIAINDVRQYLATWLGQGGTQEETPLNQQTPTEDSIYGIQPGPMPPAYESWNGVFVEYVSPGTQAHVAGLQAGDIITVFDDQSIRQVSDLIEVLAGLPSGYTASLLVYRWGLHMHLEWTVS